MRIDLLDWEGNHKYAEFDYARIRDEKDKYRILAGGYSGTAGDPFHTQYYQQRMQSMQFSTFDSDNDFDPIGNCARALLEDASFLILARNHDKNCQTRSCNQSNLCKSRLNRHIFSEKM
jgi:hypothetical protein